jgi:hypothetical protein
VLCLPEGVGLGRGVVESSHGRSLSAA